jgi:hypothetical protein
VVLQVLADARQVSHDRDAERGQFSGVAHAGKLQQLRRAERSRAHDHLPAVGAPRRPGPGAAQTARHELHPGRARPREKDPRHVHPGLDAQVWPAHPRVQVRPRGRQTAALVDVPVEGGEPLLAVPVDVAGKRVPSLLHRLEERLEKRTRGQPALEHQGPGRAAELLVRTPGSGQAVLHPLEVRQAVRVVPVGHAGIGGPPLVVERVAALEDHPVNAARPAEHLTARVVDPAAVQERLGLAGIPPVVEPAADRKRERGRHVDERIPRVVRAAGLEHEHPGGGIRGQPVRQGAARRATADDDVVEKRWGHITLIDLAALIPLIPPRLSGSP